MVTNTNDEILLKLISYDESMRATEIFQQTGGVAYLDNEPLPFDISLPFYDFEKGVLSFWPNEV